MVSTVLTALGTYMILNPQRAQASNMEIPNLLEYLAVTLY